MKTKFLFLALMSLALALPAFGWTYKNTYPVPCSEVWIAVKDTLSNPENYTVEQSDDATMKAAYKVKHSVHANVSGAVLQRTNHVTLVPKGKGCEMQVGSNYSGWEHDDKGDFESAWMNPLPSPKPRHLPSPLSRQLHPSDSGMTLRVTPTMACHGGYTCQLHPTALKQRFANSCFLVNRILTHYLCARGLSRRLSFVTNGDHCPEESL